MLSVGVLSWKAHETLRATLRSLQPLRKIAGDCVAFFNEITDADRAIAAEYGFRAEGTRENLGILGGTLGLVESMRGDVIISLQNDNPLAAAPAEAERQIAEARGLVAAGTADIVRLRDRFAPGFSDRPKFLKYWPGDGERDTIARKLRRLARPFKAAVLKGRAFAALRDPAARFPDVWTRIGGAFVSSSRYVDYTDQPFLAKKTLALDLLHWADAHKEGTSTLNGRYVPEIVLNGSGWRRRNLKIAVEDGIFAHLRKDDSFRPGHAAFNSAIASASADGRGADK